MILANLFAQDFIWAGLGLSFCCWDGKLISDTFTTSSLHLRSKMIENDLNELDLRDASVGPAPVTAGWGRDEIRSLNWTGQGADSLNGTRQICNKIRLFTLISVYFHFVCWAYQPSPRDMQLGVITKISTMSWCPYKRGVAWLAQSQNIVTMNTRQRFL